MFKHYGFFLFFLYCLLFATNSLYSENNNILKTGTGFNLSPYIEIMQDKKKSFHEKDILKGVYNFKFKKNSRDLIKFKKNVNFWIKLKLKSVDKIYKYIKNNEQKNTLLAFDTMLFHKIIFYFPDISGNYNKKILNYSDKGDFLFRYMNITLNDQVDISRDIYIMINTENFNSQFLLFSKEKFTEFIFMDTLGMGALYGALLALFLYNLVLFLILRLKAYLFYTIYLFSVIIFFLLANNHLYIFNLIPPNLSSQIYYGFASLSLLSLVLFVREFLNTRENSKLLDRLIIIDIFLTSFMLFLSLLGFFMLAIIIIRLHFFLFGALAIIAGFYMKKKGVQSARYFILAWTVLILGNYISILAGLSIIQRNYFTRNAGFIGVILEALLLSLALADKFNNWRKESKNFKDRSDYFQQLSILDELTGLYNKRFFLSKFENECKHSSEMCLPLSIIFVDIDHFKKLNDSYGHPNGDKMLKLIAELMKKTLRSTDIKCRYGGEEFVIILPNSDIKIALTLAERFRLVVEKKTLQIEKTKFISSTISSGVVQLISGEDHRMFLKRADDALYKAKIQGRNTIVNGNT